MSEQTIYYNYTDKEGNLSYQKVRLPGKDFSQRRPDGKGGWIDNLKGIAPLLYPLPETIQAVKNDVTIFFVEGEKDRDNVAAQGLAATTSGSAESWKDSFSTYLIGAAVVLLPDNDEPGRKYMNKVARSLHGKAKSIKIVELPGLPDKGDVSDWLATGTKDELLRLVAAAPEWGLEAEEQQSKELFRPITVRLSDVETEEVSWLWEPYIPIGKLTILEGDPGQGKTWAALAMVAAVTTGAGLPGQDGKPGAGYAPANALFMTGEDGLGDTLKPRLDAMGADSSRVIIPTGYIGYDPDTNEETVLPITMKNLNVLEKILAEHNPALLVIDPLQAFLGAGVDMHRSNETRPVLSGIAKLAEKHSCAVLLIRHLGKSQADRAIYRGLGSIDFTAAARSVLLAGQDPDDPTKRALIHIKSSLAQLGASIGYQMLDGQFVWTGLSELTATRAQRPEQAEGEMGALDEAKDFLLNILADGPVAAKEVERQRRGAGIKDITLRRAKSDLKIKALKQGDSWYWSLYVQNEHLDSDPETVAGVRLGGCSSRRSYEHLDLEPGTLAAVRTQQGAQGAHQSAVRGNLENPADEHLNLLEVRI